MDSEQWDLIDELLDEFDGEDGWPYFIGARTQAALKALVDYARTATDTKGRKVDSDGTGK